MIERKTVFVLGAGASAHLGYPTGQSLVSDVLTLAMQGATSETPSIFTDLGFDTQEYKDFHDALSQSGQNSVDAFIEFRPEFTDVGKSLIALALIPHENSARLFEKPSESWYNYLYQILNTRFEEFKYNTISIITFNYDRSFEEYLFTVLKNTHNKTDEEVAKVLESIPILNVHGILDDLPWQNITGRPYGSETGAGTVIKSAEKIRIIHEDFSNDGVFRNVQYLINQSEIVHFLGFGFHETNMKRLGHPWDLVNLNLASSTCYGLTEHEKNLLSQKYRYIAFAHTSWNVMDYFRNVVSLS